MNDLSQHPGEQVPAGVSMESSAVSDREQVSDKPVCTEADFPIGICDILRNLSQFFSLELGCLLLPCLAVVGAAVANWARARSQIWPTRINSALQLVICDEEPNRLSEVIDYLLAPLRQYQDARLSELSETTRKVMKKELERLQTLQAKAWLEGARDSAPDRFASPIAKLEACLRPMMLIEDPAPGQLLHALTGSIGRAVTVVYHSESLNWLLDAAKGEGAPDLHLLRVGYLGRTFNGPSLGVKWAESIVQPSVTAFIQADRDSLGRLYESQSQAIQQFAHQLVFVQPRELPLPTTNDSGNVADALDGWGQYVSGLLSTEESGGQVDLVISPELVRRTTDPRQHHTLSGRSSDSQEESFLRNVPILADKLALCCALTSATAERRQSVPGSLKDKSFRLAEDRCKQTASLAAILGKQRQQAQLEKMAEKMLRLIKQMGRSKPWPVWKRFHGHLKKKMEPVLDYLIQTDRVRRHPNGTLEAVTPGSDQVSDRIEPHST